MQGKRLVLAYPLTPSITLSKLEVRLGVPCLRSGAPMPNRHTEIGLAAKAVMEGKEGATAQLKKAANCKACHSVHKGE